MIKTEKEYQSNNKRLKEMGINPFYNSLKEEKQAKKERDNLLKKLGSQ